MRSEGLINTVPYPLFFLFWEFCEECYVKIGNTQCSSSLFPFLIVFLFETCAWYFDAHIVRKLKLLRLDCLNSRIRIPLPTLGCHSTLFSGTVNLSFWWIPCPPRQQKGTALGGQGSPECDATKAPVLNLFASWSPSPCQNMEAN